METTPFVFRVRAFIATAAVPLAAILAFAAGLVFAPRQAAAAISPAAMRENRGSLDAGVFVRLAVVRAAVAAGEASDTYEGVKHASGYTLRDLSAGSKDRSYFWDAAKNAVIAKSAAMVYALDGDKNALAKWDKAIKSLSDTAKREVRGNDLLAMDSIAEDAAISLLLVRQSLSEFDERRKTAAITVLDLARILYTNRPAWYAGGKNNWGVRQYSSLLLCAMVLSSEPGMGDEPAKWQDYAEAELPLHIAYQTLPGNELPDIAGWAEGHSYLAYSLDTLLDCWFFEALAYPDRSPAIAKELAALSKWSVLSACPTGERPNFDDSAMADFPSLPAAYILLKDYPNLASVLAWDYTYQVNFTGMKESDPVLALLSFDAALVDKYDSPAEIETASDYPTGWFDTATGDMVMRTGWSPDSSYAMMRIETGDAHWHGMGHEHWEPLSLMLFGGLPDKGEWVLLDGGYISWDEHKRVMTPDNHNMLLVDGEGPDWTADSAGALVRDVSFRSGEFDVPGFTGAYRDENGNVHYVHPPGFFGAGTTSYRGVTWRREILLLRDNLLAIRDTVTSDEPGKAKRITFPWHMNMAAELPLADCYRSSKLDGKFECMFFGLPGDKAASMEWYSDAPFELKFRTDEHSMKYGEAKKHHVADVSLPADRFGHDGRFTLYTLVGVWGTLGYLDRYDPPESIPDVLDEIWRQAE